MPKERVENMRTCLEGSVKDICYNEDKLTKSKLYFQLACYLAAKDLVKDYDMDFIALKCMHDISNSYVPQCMTVAFLANHKDAEGAKNNTPIACETDADGALTQQILKILSCGKPAFFADVSQIANTQKIMYCVNYGAICVYYAGRSTDTRENLQDILIKQSVRPCARIAYFSAFSGAMQLGKLYRKNGKSKMIIMPYSWKLPPTIGWMNLSRPEVRISFLPCLQKSVLLLIGLLMSMVPNTFQVWKEFILMSCLSFAISWISKLKYLLECRCKEIAVIGERRDERRLFS